MLRLWERPDVTQGEKNLRRLSTRPYGVGRGGGLRGVVGWDGDGVGGGLQPVGQQNGCREGGLASGWVQLGHRAGYIWESPWP